jgi:hypothetical protein
MRHRRAWLVLLLGLSGLGMGGCYKPLFPPNTNRTQFETYDQLRQRYRPVEVQDVFGNPQPALRARLSQDFD